MSGQPIDVLLGRANRLVAEERTRSPERRMRNRQRATEAEAETGAETGTERPRTERPKELSRRSEPKQLQSIQLSGWGLDSGVP